MMLPSAVARMFSMAAIRQRSYDYGDSEYYCSHCLMRRSTRPMMMMTKPPNSDRMMMLLAFSLMGSKREILNVDQEMIINAGCRCEVSSVSDAFS